MFFNSKLSNRSKAYTVCVFYICAWKMKIIVLKASVLVVFSNQSKAAKTIIHEIGLAHGIYNIILFLVDDIYNIINVEETLF